MIEQILKGGPLMIPLMLCSFISLAVVYDRNRTHADWLNLNRNGTRAYGGVSRNTRR
jgi:hypothetical protein